MDLARENNKEFFDANKSRYQKHVKAAFEGFVEQLISKMKKDYGLGELSASECIFRINRDIRFSKDKTPYKLQMSALITKGGRKNMSAPALYIEIGPEHLNLYSGVYMPEKDQLLSIRTKIAKHTKAFVKIIEEKNFVKYFEAPQGEKSKILPAELKSAAAECSYIYNKQFYIMHTIDAEKILEPGLDDYILEVYSAADDFNAFLS